MAQTAKLNEADLVATMLTYLPLALYLDPSQHRRLHNTHRGAIRLPGRYIGMFVKMVRSIPLGR